MFMAITWHRLRVGPSDMYYTRKASFKDTLFIGMHQGEPPPCAPGSCFGLYLTRCKHPDCFPILHVRKKKTLRGYFWCFWDNYFGILKVKVTSVYSWARQNLTGHGPCAYIRVTSHERHGVPLLFVQFVQANIKVTSTFRITAPLISMSGVPRTKPVMRKRSHGMTS